MESQTTAPVKEHSISEQKALINSVVAVSVENKNMMGIYVARRTGNATVLTANCAHFGQKYALFKTDQGILVYIPIPPETIGGMN